MPTYHRLLLLLILHQLVNMANLLNFDLIANVRALLMALKCADLNSSLFEEHEIRFNLIFTSSYDSSLEETESSLRSIIDLVEKILSPINTKNSLTPTDNEAESPTAKSPIEEDIELPDGAQSPTAGSPATKSPINREVELADGAICEYESLCPGMFDEDKNDLAKDCDKTNVNSVPAQKRKQRRK